MQYYRLWIYSCNVVLGITSAIFIIFAAFVVADVRLSLLEGVELYHPTFFYAYGALILQCGVVQTIGCLGAQRLSHKLLSLYWTLLLLLTLGDIGVGLYWVFHLEKVKINLRPYLSREFIEKYSTDETFTLRWNRLQSQDRCCGVNGPLDFEKFSTSQHLHSNQAPYSENSHVIVGVESGLLSLPESCCTLLYVPPTTLGSSSSSGPGLDKTYRVSNHASEEEHPSYNDHSPDPSSSSVIANDEHHNYPSDFAGGGGRRSRTVVNLTHKRNNEVSLGSTEEDDDDEEEEEDNNNVETQVYMDYVENFSYQEKASVKPLEQVSPPNQNSVVVPDNDPSDPGTRADDPAILSADSPVQTRDIKTYEPSHAHKLRHELHRKSQPSSSLIGAKLVNRTSLVLEAAPATSERNGSVEKIDEVRREGSQPRSKNSIWGRAGEGYRKRASPASQPIRGELIGIKDEEIYVPQHHHHQSHNKTNKLFPSIAFPVRRRKRRETRALSVTQVPAASAPIQRHIVCHAQPEGLNHHNSYKKDLFDQRKPGKDRSRRRAKTLPNAEKPGADWLYRRTANRTSKPNPSSLPDNKLELEASAQAQAELTSAEITEKIGANEIEMLTKSKRRKRLMAIRKAQRIMTGSADAGPSSPFHFFKLAPTIPSHRKGTTANVIESRKRQRNARDAEMNRGKSYSTLESQSIGIPQRSTFTFHEIEHNHEGRTARSITSGHNSNSDSFAESHFLPLSSSSTTSHLEVKDPQSTIVSPSASSYDRWQEDDDYTHGNDGGNSSGDVQKTLYVYGVGCGVKLIEWVDHVSGIGFIIGFCIICFAKTCFLVILRTEIQEMIEKINMIEPEEVMSPSRNPSKVSHPLLQNPHRSSTTSAHCALLPTIKSPDGPATSLITSAVISQYNRPNRHYLRRASNIVGGDRSRSHSNETVNMTLLMASSHDSEGRERLRSNPNLSNARGSTGTITNLEEKDPVSGLSITVPSGGSTTGSSCAAMGAARYLRRSSTCTSSANSYYPYGYGLEVEPRAGPSSRFYQYFEPIYQTPHLYQQHHHHHYTRNRSHSRNMSCGAILPLASYRSNSVAATYRGGRNLSSTASTTTTNMPNSGGYSYGSTSRDENEMIISVSLEHIASSDQDEDPDLTAASATLDEHDELKELEKQEQEKKEWAAATSNLDKGDGEAKSSSKAEGCVGTKLQTFTHSEPTNETIPVGGGSNNDCAELTGQAAVDAAEREFQRRNGNNNIDLSNLMPMSYIGTAV